MASRVLRIGPSGVRGDGVSEPGYAPPRCTDDTPADLDGRHFSHGRRWVSRRLETPRAAWWEAPRRGQALGLHEREVSPTGPHRADSRGSPARHGPRQTSHPTAPAGRTASPVSFLSPGVW